MFRSRLTNEEKDAHLDLSQSCRVNSVKGKRLRHNPRFRSYSHSCMTRNSTSFGHLCAYFSMSWSRLTHEEKDARLDLSQSRQVDRTL